MFRAAVSKQVKAAKDIATSLQSSVFNFFITIASYVGGLFVNRLVGYGRCLYSAVFIYFVRTHCVVGKTKVEVMLCSNTANSL